MLNIVPLKYNNSEYSEAEHEYEKRRIMAGNQNNGPDLSHINIRPWVRWWARLLDYLIFAFFCAPIAHYFTPAIMEAEEFILSMLVVFGWIFVESFLLSTCGTTPGKWLMKISLNSKDNGNLSFQNALKRSLYVWSAGMGIGYPILALVTLIMGYRTLKTHGIARWDEAVGIRVTHEKIGLFRIALISVLIYLLVINL